MESWNHLALGFGVASTPLNLLYAFCGSALGTLVGVLPGLAPVGVVAMLLPAVLSLDATSSLVLLAGVYVGAQYGGSIRAILVPASERAGPAATAVDGVQMSRQGRAATALAIATLGSFFAGCVSTALIAAGAPLLGGLASRLGPTEVCSLMVLGLVGAAVLASGSLVKALAMIVLGMLLAQLDAGLKSGVFRLADELPRWGPGRGLSVLAIGIFGIGEIIERLGHHQARREVVSTPQAPGRWVTREDLRLAWPAAWRGTALGSLLGLLPGGGASLASFAAYTLEKERAGPGGRFGRGDIRAVAGPRSASNAGAHTAFLPVFTFGFAPNAVTALVLGAMTIQGVETGPQFVRDTPRLYWALVASLWIGNAMLALLNVPWLALWTRLSAVPYRWVFPVVLALCAVGLATLGNHAFEVYLAAAFALLGHVFHKLNCETAPLLLGFVLGPPLESNLRLALARSAGDWSPFIVHPLSAGLLGGAVLLMVLVALPSLSKRREGTFLEE